jgi:hypothetical protein
MESIAMATKAKKGAAPPKEIGPVQLNLRVPPEMAEALDQWVEELNRKRTWPKLNRTDVLRALLDRALKERPDL